MRPTFMAKVSDGTLALIKLFILLDILKQEYSKKEALNLVKIVYNSSSATIGYF
jgi:uncharacterized PurR-regulated membrane protein YhhQ (DUF165 family)